MKDVFRFVVLFLGISICGDGFAGPTIIRDKRISDLALTPTLGRGYTIITNTYQSKCLDNIRITEPSYDFQYIFESIDTSSSKHLSTMVNFGLKIPIKVVSVGGGASLSTSVTTTETSHHIYAEINMDTYYASIDEARTRMSPSAASLLKNNDIPGFFNSCGSYYVRSLGRNARFVAIYTYTTKSSQKDVSFEADLKADILSFSVEGLGSSKCGLQSALCPGQQSDPSQPVRAGSGANKPKISGMAGVAGGAGMSMSLKSQEYKLNILTRAYGLGKNEGATLISYDVPTFKAAVKDAFLSMQNPMTGKVTTMEIVPWVENTEFQNLIKLEKEVIDSKTGKSMLLYKKKQILNLNAEFLAEIERHDRNLMNIYYKSKVCRQTIEASWMKDKETIRTEYKDLEIGNNKFPLKKIRLDKLLTDHLTEEKIEQLLLKQEDFMYGSSGANACITKLLDSGMFAVSYRDIEECKRLKGKMSAVINEAIDSYCMPEVARKVVTDQPDGQAGQPAPSRLPPQ